MRVGLLVCLLQTIKDAFDAIRTLAINVNAYGVVTSEEQARSIIKTHADMVIAPAFTPPPSSISHVSK